jgi:hypothetical protein
MISEFSGRLLIVAVVGGAASAIASKSSTGAEQLVASQDGWRTATLYVSALYISSLYQSLTNFFPADISDSCPWPQCLFRS